MRPTLTILAPSAFEASHLRHGLAGSSASAEVIPCGIGAGAAFSWPGGPSPAAGDTVILSGVAGALVPSCPPGSAHWASVVVDAEGRRWVPPIQGRNAVTLAGTDGVIATPAAKAAEHARSGAAMVDCESATFARTATARGWRWGIVRGISDGADESIPHWMPALLRRDGSIDAVAVARTLLANPMRAIDMMRSGQSAARAMRSVCDLLVTFAGEPIETRGSRRVLLFGGTFDPPHQRHVSMASAAATLMDCDRIVVMPAGRSPLRRGVETAPPELRVQMARAAFAAEPRAIVSDLEVRRGGTSYTVDTLVALGAGSHRARTDTVLLIGSDQALQFAQWRDAARILDELAAVAVVLRPPDDAHSFARRCSDLGGGASEWAQRLLPLAPVDLSATAIRSALVRGDDPASLPGLDPAVARLIDRSGLYRSATMLA
jgi:nicotinate-nucleotide adenylyltransferase